MSVDKIIQIQPYKISLVQIGMVLFFCGITWAGYQSLTKTVNDLTQTMATLNKTVATLGTDQIMDHNRVERIVVNNKTLIEKMVSAEKKIVNIDTRLMNVERVVNK